MEEPVDLTISRSAAIQQQLLEVDNLQECVITDVRFLAYQTEFLVDLRCPPFSRRSDWDAHGPGVRMTFHSVREAIIRNALSEDLLREPGRMSWGMNSVSQVLVVHDSEVAGRYLGESVPAVHVAFHWEAPMDGKFLRQIDVIAGDLSIDRLAG
jgi:hypothetical protein